jgi:GMP synthase (glutamine-hydrolysing)
MRPRKVLIVLHQEHSTPGRVGRLLQQAGVELDIRRPRFGDPLPNAMRDHSGAIIFGGPMSANDADDYITREIDWIGVPLRDNKPFLGICLGAQMLVRHLGHKVSAHPNGRVEIGYYPINPTPEAERLAIRCGAAFPEHVYHWHREGFDLPTSARLLAQGDDFPVQAFTFGEQAYAIQFHPEVTYAMICRWTTRVPDRLSAPGAWPRERHLEGWFQHDAAVGAWLGAFLTTWLDGDRAAER